MLARLFGIPRNRMVAGLERHILYIKVKHGQTMFFGQPHFYLFPNFHYILLKFFDDQIASKLPISTTINCVNHVDSQVWLVKAIISAGDTHLLLLEATISIHFGWVKFLPKGIKRTQPSSEGLQELPPAPANIAEGQGLSMMKTGIN